MDERALLGLLEGSSSLERQMTLEYFEQLKNFPEGWRLCGEEFMKNIHRDDRIRFFFLQVIEHHVRQRHAVSTEQDIMSLRTLIISWLQPLQESQKQFIRNKMAQIIALTFVVDYPQRWPNFFSDLMSCLEHVHVWTVDMYLRVLLAIDPEIVDREYIHTHDENSRNTVIKDYMRDTCVPQLVESWLQILMGFEQTDHELTCLVMKVIGLYVSWIDIALIANDRFMSLILKYFTIPTLREAAADCLHGIISKGMDPLPKIHLVESLVKVLVDVGVLTTVQQSDNGDVDFQSKMSTLINGVGQALITSCNKLQKMEDHANYRMCLEAVEEKIPYMLRYLTDEDDEVSENVINFAVQYISLLKHHTDCLEDRKESLQALLYAVILKLKYDQDFNFVNQGEDEAIFLEYRAHLKIVFDNISQLVPSLVIRVCQSLLSSTLANLPCEPFMNVEVALKVLYMLGEAIPEKQFGSASTLESPFHQALSLVVSSQLSYHTHTAVLLQYYETIVRYDKFFLTTQGGQYISAVLEGFLDERGLHHHSPAVRSRLCYLFLRFIRAVRTQLGDVAKRVLSQLQDLLLMIPGTLESKGFLSGSDMVFLYEAAGFLVVHASCQPEEKKEMMSMLLSPLLEKFSQYLPELQKVSTPSLQEEIAQILRFLLSYASCTSKVFPNHTTTKQSGCLECFVQALQVLLPKAEEVQVQRELLCSGIRQYLHRMIICLGDELLQYIPQAVSLLLSSCQPHDIIDFIPLINQLITKYKERIIPFLQEVFLPMVQTIASFLNQPCSPQDTEDFRERQTLQKSYYQFIHSIATNGVIRIIASQGKESLDVILNTLIDGAVNFPDPSVQKTCFFILKKTVEAWGSEESFMEYMYKQVLPACFLAPMSPDFDLNDVHAFLTLGEISGCLKAMISTRREECIVYLQHKYLPSIEVPPDLSQELLVKLQESDTRSLKPYMRALFSKLRASPVLTSTRT